MSMVFKVVDYTSSQKKKKKVLNNFACTGAH